MSDPDDPDGTDSEATGSGLASVEATLIDGSDDLVLTVAEQASDAWLLER